MKQKLFSLCLLLLVAFGGKAQSVQDYIDSHTEIAQALMHESNIPASIILGVAIHESAAGKSKIARYLNNHFGVKGPNDNTMINSSYRDYDDDAASYSHFVEIMLNRPAFSRLADKYSKYDYRAWARGIQRGGYAASRTWASQVINIINRYELFKYDERPEGYKEPVYKKAYHSKKKKSFSSKKKTVKSGWYTVKRGDNLNALAEKRGTTARALMQKNGLKKSTLQPGQKLRL
ncbi:glucosaminidase domain-containing protein [Pedobacter sp. SYP-B3415]|uniref:glucosaminidase domain and LysM peptidoglycan-binding domain-containing protein n=1 Tax=Pedobacter sp. SYP-B3415 TaxID=2496641 RepID=UPI00101C1DE7|nr:glucosaminidase domain-containing protein [Pedobacter sp. SYP-B3415]